MENVAQLNDIAIERGFDRKKLIKWIISIMMMFTPMLMQVNENYTINIRTFFMITILIIMIWAFELMPLAAPALVLPIVYISFGLATPAQAFSPWTTEMPWLFIGGMVISSVFERTGLMKRMAITAIKTAGGTYKGILFGFLIVGLTLCIIIPSTAARTTLFLPLAYGIITALDLKKNSKEAIAIMAGSSFMALTPWTIVDGINLISYSIARNLNVHLSWIEYMKEMGIMTFLLSTVYIIAILFFYKGNASIFKKENHFKTKEYFDKEHSKLGKMTISEKKVIFVLAIMVAILCTSSIHKISAGWVFAIGAFCFYLPGINVAEDKDLKSVNMPMIILMTGAMTIGAVSMATGTGAFIGKILTGYLTGSSFAIVSISWLIGVIVNFLLTPLAAASALTQPLVEAAIQNGISPTVILNSYAVGLEQIIFPYEYVLPLMMFSYGVMSLKEFVKIYLLKMILSIIFLLVICVPYWGILGLL
ncbi:SLC13 family permease [Cetobacterium somerae]|uniref:SLC13 family permease n=1 Tax=Cetobacterium TaxID=180162 RepID=UPI001F0512ED|nr:SLC13 family permease [Cetobacterium somerae]MCX3065875.1 SLC13 family permease [Cetobacterium somerae]UPO98016.1 SLC13 family permease [Cetobacterium somerae]